VILLAQVNQTAADQGQLLPLVEQVTLDQRVAPQLVSADAGYWKESDVELLEINDIEPFVAPKRVTHSQWREMKAPRGRIPKNLDRKERILCKLSTQRGRAEYGKRKTSAEPKVWTDQGSVGLQAVSVARSSQSARRMVVDMHGQQRSQIDARGMEPEMRGKLIPGGRIRLAEQSGLVLLRRMKLLKIYHLDFKTPLTTSFPYQSTITRTRP